MGVFEPTDAALLTTAFENALSNYGVAKIGGSSTETIDPAKIDDDNRNAESNKKANISPGAGDIAGGGKSTGQMQKEINAFTQAMTLPARAIKVYDDSLNALSKTVDPVLKQYNTLQEGYGGLNIDLDKATGSSKAVIERLQSMQEYYYNVGDAGTDMSKKLGFSRQGNTYKTTFL